MENNVLISGLKARIRDGINQPGNPYYDEYQALIEAITEKQEAQAQLSDLIKELFQI
jgi:hypothetical protein